MAKATQTKTEAKWEEFYLACQAANASHELLRAIHDIKESIEDAEYA